MVIPRSLLRPMVIELAANLCLFCKMNILLRSFRSMVGSCSMFYPVRPCF